MGRFINADVYTSTGQGFVGNNMFAYCNNNPVCLVDPSGNIAKAYDRDLVGYGGGSVGGLGLLYPFVKAAELAGNAKDIFDDWLNEQKRAVANKVAQSLAKSKTNHSNPNTHKHHIVPQNDPRGLPAYVIIQEVFPEYGVDDPRNTIQVSSRIHARLHTDIYYAYDSCAVAVHAHGYGEFDWKEGSQVGIAAFYDFTLPEMIPLIGETFDVSTDFALSVYGEKETLYDNYSLYITQARALNEYYLSCGEDVEIDDVITNCMDYRIVTSEEIIQLSLTPGIYELAVVDNVDIEKTKVVTIQVFDESESKSNELTVYTDFGGLLDEEQEEGKKNESITEIVENYTGLHCEWAVSGDFDDDGNDEIYALLCASSTNYSDGQLWHFASTGNRCLFYIEEAEFETLCSIAQKIPDWLAVEVIDAVDNIDTFISDIERRYF